MSYVYMCFKKNPLHATRTRDLEIITAIKIFWFFRVFSANTAIQDRLEGFKPSKRLIINDL